jgi:hypothetical protein
MFILTSRSHFLGRFSSGKNELTECVSTFESLVSVNQHGFRGHESKRAGFIAASDARQVSSRHREAEIPRLVPKSSELIIRKLTAIPSA